ncbi:MAG TPA: response regulator [Blastocatellia bacterium]|nr:response regulator [Blastocatellia bacterium]
MASELRLLILEDKPHDAELDVAVLEDAGYRCKWDRVDTREEFIKRLDRPDFEIVLCDFSLPSFDGLAALELFTARNLDIPFIFVSGTLGEDIAIECLKAGATDYVVKSHLSRLGPVVARALRERNEQSKHKQAALALRESEERLQAILDNSPALIYTRDKDLRFTFVNRRFETLFGVKKESMKNKTAHELFAREVADILISHCGEVLSEKAPREFEEVIPHEDAPHTYVTIRFPLYDSEHALSGLCSISTDVTESKVLEEQLRQAQKMEAIGRLAGGVAHDFNNLLTAIIGYSQIVLASLGPNDMLRKEVEEIQKAGKRASALTSQLLAFSRRQVLQPSVIDLNVVVGNTTKMLRRLIGEDIHLETILSPELGRVKIDPGQIEQVIMNLAVNARDAMPAGGKLTIETNNAPLDEAYVREHITVEPGRYVMLAVTDTGLGMNSETRSHIFEPFFTTKEKGMGTGLGLSMVYGIVKQSGGNIWVYSEPGQGTTFRIYLPQVEEAEEAASQLDDAEYLPRGTETVLLVEDEQAVRDLSARILRELGYTVFEASNGEEALAISNERAHGEIQLLLTDVVMPQMSGKLLTDLVKAARPGIRILFSSGYTDNALVHHGSLAPGTAFLQKPFSPGALARKVREVLDKRD